MTHTVLSRRVEMLLLAFILLLAGVLRLGWPGLTEFKADEAGLLALALEMVQDHRLAWRGISSSVGFPNFPMSVWLYALARSVTCVNFRPLRWRPPAQAWVERARVGCDTRSCSPGRIPFKRAG